MENTCLLIKALGTATFGACGEEKEEKEKPGMLGSRKERKSMGPGS